MSSLVKALRNKGWNVFYKTKDYFVIIRDCREQITLFPPVHCVEVTKNREIQSHIVLVIYITL